MLIFNKEYRAKIKANSEAEKWSEKAWDYVKKIYRVYDYIYYCGYACTLYNIYGTKCLQADILGREDCVFNFDDIKTKADYKDFKKEIEKTFKLNLSYTEEDFFNLFVNNGAYDVIDARNAMRYTLERNEHNYIFAVEETDGRKWFRRGSGSSGSNGSFPFNFENVSESTIVSILNFIRHKEHEAESK